MELQLIIKNDLEKTFSELIEFNYEELKSVLQASLEKYRGIAYTENQVREAKATRASLNKLRDAIDNERKAVRARCLAQIADFEEKTRELFGLVDEQSKEIDSQVKKFESEKKSRRKAEIAQEYADAAGDLTSLVPFDKIFKETWLNVSTSKAAVTDAIKKIVSGITSDLQVIDGFGGDLTLQCKDVYLRTLNLSDALQEKTRLEQLAERLAQQKAALEAKKAAAREEMLANAAAREERLVQQPVQQPLYEQPERVVPETRPQAPVAAPQPTQQTEKLYSLTFTVKDATGAQLQALKQFLIDNNIKFERA